MQNGLKAISSLLNNIFLIHKWAEVFMKLYKKHISDLGKVITGKTPRTSILENYGGKIPFLTPSDNLSEKFSPTTSKTLTKIGLNEVKNCLLPSKSICVSCIGSDLGKVVLTKKPTVTNQQFNSIVPNEENDADFIYYLMTVVGKHLNYLSKTSTAVPIINKSTFANYEIEIPNIKEQKRIGEILSSLDDKIELNRRINDNLEQQAQALFNEMFPHITEGENMIGNLIMPKRGKGLLSKNAIKGDIPVVAGGIEPATYHNQANTTAPVLTIAASGANAGYINLWHIPVWASDSSYIDDSITPNVYFWYIMLKKRQKEIFDAQVGSAQPHIYPKHIAELPMNVVFVEKIAEYNEIVTPIFEKKGQLFLESKRLTSLRDTLLPKLMSGELKINDINN